MKSRWQISTLQHALGLCRWCCLMLFMQWHHFSCSHLTLFVLDHTASSNRSLFIMVLWSQEPFCFSRFLMLRTLTDIFNDRTEKEKEEGIHIQFSSGKWSFENLFHGEKPPPKSRSKVSQPVTHQTLWLEAKHPLLDRSQCPSENKQTSSAKTLQPNILNLREASYGLDAVVRVWRNEEELLKSGCGMHFVARLLSVFSSVFFVKERAIQWKLSLMIGIPCIILMAFWKEGQYVHTSKLLVGQ